MVGEVTKRRKHKNSKFGCPNCKKRRVKCSEDLPQCLNCIKHKVRCGYLDYPEDKLEELRGYKNSQLSMELLEDKDLHSSLSASKVSISSNDSTMVLSKNSFSKAPQSISSKSSIPHLDRSLSHNSIDDEVNNLTMGFKSENFSSTHSPSYTNNNFNNILNFPSNTISQNFDNLAEASDFSIVYPVYSITNTQGLSPFNLSNTNYVNTNPFSPTIDPNLNIQQNALLQSLNSNRFTDDQYGSVSPNTNTHMTNASIIPQESFIDYQSPSSSKSYVKKLPNAIESDFKFKKLKKLEVDYRSLLIDVVVKLTPFIKTGRATLIQIRELYNLWLNSFLFKSYHSELMCSCLLNLTTNFLISNTFNNFNLIDSNTHSFLDITNTKNILIMVSIKYYSITIKGLRNFLNKNFAPELCSSVSYILSLMSIYDPEATCNSTKCFSDGLFSVLKYNIDLSIKKGFTPPVLIPIHLKLMHNIEKSIYFPGYDPTFLIEYQTKLHEFGKILNKLNSNQIDPHLLKLLKKYYENLVDFINVTLKEYLPILLSNLTNNSIQQEILFRMTSKWVRLFPSPLLLITERSHIIEMILYLFYKFFKKAMFAILPQVKFYFLRDFDSPLMTDVFMFLNDTDIYNRAELDAPEYKNVKDELKNLISYVVRCLNYFQKRLQFLYQTIVYQPSTEEYFPIEDRKDFVINIENLRKIFYNTLGIRETNIMSFDKTFIRPSHFPHVEEGLIKVDIAETPIAVDEGDENLSVNYMTLTSLGFLEDDIIS